MKRTLALLLPALAAHAQYSGKVGGAAPKPVLRALAVYEYTGTLQKPNASRLVPVAVWDGASYQPGGLYLARPEPLAVAPGTQYVLEKSGQPEGLFNISSAAKLSTGSWVGLGRFQAEAPPPPPAKLKASKQLPVLTGGSGKGKAEPDQDSEDRPTLHRKTDGSPAPPSGSEPADKSNTDANSPTLHRRDSDQSTTNTDHPTLHRKDSGDAAPAPDPDRPTLHRSDTAAGNAPDPDRPVLHRHADAPATVSTADPDRPHLRYVAGEDETHAAPALLEVKAGAAPAGAAPVEVADAVAVSDTAPADPHPYAYAWPTPQARADAEAAMHALALKALASVAQSSFGPGAKSDAALRRAAAASQASFGPGTKTRRRAAPAPAAAADPLVEPQLTALELSYGSGATYVYSAHTAPEGPARRYVTVIAKPDFNGKPQSVFTQTTKGDELSDTPALHLVDAVDANGDNRAELLFRLETAATLADPQAARQFALYGVNGNRAELLYTSEPVAR